MQLMQHDFILALSILQGLRHSSNGYSLAFHGGGPSSIPGLVKWDL
jgi:hypothetical protein